MQFSLPLEQSDPEEKDTLLIGWLSGMLGEKLGENLTQFALEPGMQDGVGRGRHATRSHVSGGRTKQGQHLGGPIADVFMRLEVRMTLRLPTGSRIGDRLIRSSLILAP